MREQPFSCAPYFHAILIGANDKPISNKLRNFDPPLFQSRIKRVAQPFMFWKFCYLGGVIVRGVFVLGGNCPGGNCPGVIVRGVIVRGVIVLEPNQAPTILAENHTLFHGDFALLLSGTRHTSSY